MPVGVIEGGVEAQLAILKVLLADPAERWERQFLGIADVASLDFRSLFTLLRSSGQPEGFSFIQSLGTRP